VFIAAERIVTSGPLPIKPRISADGQAGSDAGILSNDGPGGGGAGGSILIQLPTDGSGRFGKIIVSAKGGDGGSLPENVLTANEIDGGGGSGGGGAVYTNANITAVVDAGNAGLNLKAAISQFPPNGATNGCIGVQGLLCVPPSPSVSPSLIPSTFNQSHSVSISSSPAIQTPSQQSMFILSP